MAFKCLASVPLLLIVTVYCLMGIRAEEEQPLVTGDREGREIFFLPQTYPVQSPLYYQDSFAFGANPFEISGAQLSPSDRNQEASVPTTWPWVYPALSLNHPDYAAWRVNDGVRDKDNSGWWRRRYNRQALITIIPAAAECLTVDAPVNGLGPCKRATDANYGTLEVRLQTADQTAVIGITSKSPMNTRIRLLCTDLTAVAVFTNSGKINAVSDTPRTEIGQTQLVVTSTDANGLLKCSWKSYHYYTAAFP